MKRQLNSLKRCYMTFHWKASEDFFDYIEDSMIHDSLIGSTISTRSNNNPSCARKKSSPSVLSHDNPLGFYPKNFNHGFLPKPCSMLRRQSQFMIYFRLFLELDLVCQTGMYHDSNIWIMVSCLSNRDITWIFKHVISVLGSMCHTSHLWTNINHH
jgi:hypothetical protein